MLATTSPEPAGFAGIIRRYLSDGLYEVDATDSPPSVASDVRYGNLPAGVLVPTGKVVVAACLSQLTIPLSQRPFEARRPMDAPLVEGEAVDVLEHDSGFVHDGAPVMYSFWGGGELVATPVRKL